jgi:hypothetical protein
MHVKGNAWLARVEAMEKSFGAARWQAFVKTVAPRVKFLATQVLPISRIPVEEFLLIHDELVKEFYAGDKQAYWRFGETSAEWALAHQLRGLFAQNEGRRFLQFSPQIYKGYFDGGELVTEAAPAHVDLVIRGVEPRHVYFEYSIIGFASGGLRVLGLPTEPQCITGFSKGDAEVRYRFAVTK